MEHPFQSRRDELKELTSLEALCSAVVVLSTGTPHTISCLQARRDVDIKDKETRDVVFKYSNKIGLLMEELTERATKLGIHRHDKICSKLWSSFLEGRATLSTMTVLSKNLEITRKEVTEKIQQLKHIEEDDDVSSSSDYSDSRTISTDEEVSGEEVSGEEDESEEEGENGEESESNSTDKRIVKNISL